MDVAHLSLARVLGAFMSSWEGAGPASARARSVRARQLRIKRFIDVVGAIAALSLLSPLFIVAAFAVRLDGAGSVIFRQERLGLDGKRFVMVKFRTLRADHCDPSGLDQVSLSDPRLTRTGRFLRQTSIDELPQLINVLAGDMSLVGPRPHVPGMKAAGMPYEELVPNYPARLSMTPGITGWAQANGLRGPTRDAHLARERIEHDLHYIEHFSLAFDLRILGLTIWREFITGANR